MPSCGRGHDVHGNSVDVYRNRVDVYESSVDVYGNLVDLPGTSVEVYGNPVEVYEASVDLYENPVEVYGTSVDLHGNAVETPCRKSRLPSPGETPPSPEKETPMSTDYIPRADGPFLEWARNFHNYALAHYSQWQTPSPQALLEAPLAAYAAAWDKCQNPNRGKVDVLEKDEARKVLEKACRTYYRAYIDGNPQIPDADRDNLGVPIPDATRTPSTPPATFPMADKIDTSVLRQITIHFRDNGSNHKAKPKGAHGCEIRWGLLDAPPASVEDLTHSNFDTNSPVTLAFDESQRGKTVYFCLRWEGNTGLKGPYGEIDRAIVP